MGARGKVAIERFTTAAALFLALSVGYAQAVLAITAGKDTLAGAKSFRVLVELLSKDAKWAGLDYKGLIILVEAEMRRSRLPVKDEALDGKLYINVNVICDRQSRRWCVYNVAVEFHQPVKLRGHTVFGATTWSKGHVGLVGKDRLNAAVIEVLRDKLLPQFTNDFLKANPGS